MQIFGKLVLKQIVAHMLSLKSSSRIDRSISVRKIFRSLRNVFRFFDGTELSGQTVLQLEEDAPTNHSDTNLGSESRARLSHLQRCHGARCCYSNLNEGIWVVHSPKESYSTEESGEKNDLICC